MQKYIGEVDNFVKIESHYQQKRSHVVKIINRGYLFKKSIACNCI
jgi:hypothetical protein